MKSPVLLLIFNRPDSTAQVVESIRQARPPRLYVAADGPRASRPGEWEQCEAARRIATDVDWPCEVRTLFRDRNLGCKRAVAEGISWFFEHEEEGVILEDDVVPLPTFYPFCDELLERYRADDRIAMISGCNPVAPHLPPGPSYVFCRRTHIWGWASWRRAWGHYDPGMKQWPAFRRSGELAAVTGGSVVAAPYWRDMLDTIHAGDVDTWDFQWLFTCWRLGSLCILPARTQTINVGFAADATHVGGAPAWVAASPPAPLHFPLEHPATVSVHPGIDQLLDRHAFEITWRNLAARLLLRMVPGLRRLSKAIRHFPGRAATS